MLNCKKLACLTAGLILSSASAAADFSFSGTFNQDDDVQLFSFSVLSASSVTMRSWGYAGGINAAGQPILRGGFDPVLAFYDNSGNLIDINDDGDPFVVAADAVTFANGDPYLQGLLPAGDYQVSITQFDNFPIGLNLSDGFFRAGAGNYTAAFGCGGDAFCDLYGDQRDNRWALDILNVNSAVNAVPEPETYAMLLAGLGLLGFAARRRRRQEHTA